MKRYSAYIFDQDGTVYLDTQPLPGVVDTISKLRSFGFRTIFLSNNPTKSRDQYAKKLSSIGIPTLEEEIINSSYVLTHWLLKVAPKSQLFVIGEEPLKNELLAAGFVLTEAIHEIDFVVASFDRTFTYSKLQIAFDAIRSGAKLIATNPNRYCPTQKGGEPDCGAITAAIETCINTKCEVIIGKPSSIMIEMILLISNCFLIVALLLATVWKRIYKWDLMPAWIHALS